MKVKQLQLTKAIFIPGMGQLSDRLLGGKHNPASIELAEGGAICIAKGVTFYVPNEMIECALIKEKADVKEAPKKA